MADSVAYYGDDNPTWQVPTGGKNTARGQFAWHDTLHSAIGAKDNLGSVAIIALANGEAEGYIQITDDDRVILLGNGRITFKNSGEFSGAELDIVGGTQNAGSGRVTIDVVNPKRYTIPF
jgi:hypothetical protein